MSPPVPVLRGDTALCAHVGPEDACVSMARLEGLAALYLTGIRRLMLVDTAAPVDGIMAMDKEAVARFNSLLMSRGLEPLAMKVAGATSKAAAVLHAQATEIAATANRRSAFRSLVPHDQDEDVPTALAQVQALEADGPDALFFAAPVIDPSACTGCDACFRACPADVLIHINDSASDGSYGISPAGCDACGLCVDICTPTAIGLAYMTQRPDDIALTNWTCTACGVRVHAPMANAATDGMCDICRRTGHHKKLYQVLP